MQIHYNSYHGMKFSYEKFILKKMKGEFIYLFLMNLSELKSHDSTNSFRTNTRIFPNISCKMMRI